MRAKLSSTVVNCLCSRLRVVCVHFVLQAINIQLQLYPTVDKPKILSPYEIYFVHTPEVSPHTIEYVFCVFGLVLDLVLVFVDFGLF